MTDVISVRFRSGCKEYYYAPKGLTNPAGPAERARAERGAAPLA